MADNYDDYSKEELINLLRSRDRKPRFGLYWERDDIEHERAINDDFVALDLNKSLSCGDAPYQNLIIEGDNFDALRYLRMTYKGKVKCIYIDPPYNTGNKDFVYNDRFIDKDDVYKHSKWLEFMYRRLELARDLLAEDGVIFVSIDDNEVAHLRLLMDSVFGWNNFLCTFAWEKRYSPPPDTKEIGYLHESIHAYRASPAFKRNLLPMTDQQTNRYKNPDNDPRGAWQSMDYTCRYTAKERPNLYYPIIQPNTGEEIFPKTTRVWAMSRDVHEKNVAENRIWWGSDGKKTTPRLKNFISKIQQGMIPTSLLRHEEVGHTDEAAKELREILSEIKFTPKPTRLITHLMQIASDKDSIVLDFFAGSGTTAHAVLKLNAEDNGNRRFILVSNTEATESEPDKNLCRDVCAERVRRVMQGYSNQKAEQVEGLGGSFAYLKTRRITSDILLTEIQHSQIWTALQLSHGAALSAFNPASSVQQLQTDNDVVMYCCKLTEQELTAVTDCLQTLQTVVVYCWQPALLTQYIDDENLTCLPIPQILIDRFGTGVKA
ncbi:MAG: site-specific DNA-methyltransferase [Methylococcales bacterium]|nr:site-specific DNA-methyltransferase [Methylococcales bacterium]